MSSPEYVAADVQQLRSSQQDDPVTLLLYPSDDRDHLAEDIANLATDQIDIEEVGQTVLRITVPESMVDDLCSLNSIKSIGVEQDAEH